jgi:hypothetical protein
MKLFPNGIEITDLQYAQLLDYGYDAETPIMDFVNQLVLRAKDGMCNYWIPVMSKDPNIPSFPKSKDDICNLALSQTYYKTYAERYPK